MAQETIELTATLSGELINPDHIHVDVTLIPDYVWDDLAAATLDLIRGILRQPGGREMLDAKTEERKKRQADENASDRQGAEHDAESVDP